MTGRPGHCLAPAGKDCWLGACACPVPEPAYDPGPLPLAGSGGAELLDEVAAFLESYVIFPGRHAAAAVALWAAHTHLVSRFESTPRLALLSPEKQCGKSRVLELLELLCAGAETLSDASPAYLYRRIGAGSVTILLDEADAIWKRGKADETAEALRSVVNAGHRRSATVGRVEMSGVTANLVRFPVYAPAAIAGIGSLPDTILDRAVILRMRRRAPGQRIRGYRERTTRPQGEALRDQLAKWAADVADRVGDPWPDMPSGVADRPADVWEPLLMVASLAGGGWPKRAAEACAAFVADASHDTETAGTRLLADLRDVLGGQDELWTGEILSGLHALDESPWGERYGHPLTPRQLAKLLKPYGVTSAQVRKGEVNRRGYRRRDLRDAWQSYLPRAAATAATSATGLASAVADVAAVADTPAACTVCGNPLDPALAGLGDTTHPMCDPEGETTVKLSSQPPVNKLLRSQPGRARAGQCRACLLVTDDLRNGLCRDRAACEARQPALDLGAEVKPGGSFGHPDASDSADGS